ncbi:MAG TPA: hypothetical protein VHM88_09085 [Candidatus Acidoferrales bacterium]|nr:hypothetical protein [Candidatus Acidoferrales bacterium]
MKRLQYLVTFILVLLVSVPAHADKAKSAYNRGAKAEAQNNYDAAYEAYQEAYALNPKNPKYVVAFVRLRSNVALEHIRKGEMLREGGKLPEALAEFQRAAEIDHSNFVGQKEAQRTADMIKRQARHEEPAQSPLAKMAAEAAGPVELQPVSNTPINVRMSSNADQIYRVIGKIAGINVLFDPDYRPQHISIELNDVAPREALTMLAMETKTFWQPVSPNTILVAADTSAKRKELEGNVMKTFYLRNVSSASELQEAASTLRGILDLNRIQLIPTQNAMVLRGTSDQLVLAEKLLSDIDKPKAEVVINIAVMEVSRDRVRTLGISPPTSASIVMSAPAPTSGTGGAASGGGNTLTLNQFAKLTGNNFLVTIPGSTLSVLMSDANTKVIQNPEIRALDNEKATLKIGDRVPVATGSFTPGIGGGGISPLVNTQFQYLDVGVNIDIVPHIHSEHEVTLKMSLEISSVSSVQNIGGINQPVIGQRRIEHNTRLLDGDVNLVGGILADTETQSLSGYPWLAKIPILKYLFGQEEKEKHEREIVFAITPHIVRAQDITEQNERLLDVGTGNSLGIRHKESPTKPTTKPSNQNPAATPTPQTPAPQAPSPQPTPPEPPQSTSPTSP